MAKVTGSENAALNERRNPMWRPCIVNPTMARASEKI